jgi:hypothetical protein
MLTFPVTRPVDSYVQNGLTKRVKHGDRKPLGTLSGLDPIPLLPGLFFELNGVKKDKDVALIDQVKVPHPREVGGLHDH